MLNLHINNLKKKRKEKKRTEKKERNMLVSERNTDYVSKLVPMHKHHSIVLRNTSNTIHGLQLSDVVCSVIPPSKRKEDMPSTVPSSVQNKKQYITNMDMNATLIIIIPRSHKLYDIYKRLLDDIQSKIRTCIYNKTNAETNIETTGIDNDGDVDGDDKYRLYLLESDTDGDSIKLKAYIPCTIKGEMNDVFYDISRFQEIMDDNTRRKAHKGNLHRKIKKARCTIVLSFDFFTPVSNNRLLSKIQCLAIDFKNPSDTMIFEEED